MSTKRFDRFAELHSRLIDVLLATGIATLVMQFVLIWILNWMYDLPADAKAFVSLSQLKWVGWMLLILVLPLPLIRWGRQCGLGYASGNAFVLTLAYWAYGHGATWHWIAMGVLGAALVACDVAMPRGEGSQIESDALGTKVQATPGAPQEKTGSAYQFPATRPRYNFSVVRGMQETRTLLLEAGDEILKGSGACNGILLTGDPGNGKTFLAEALAGEMQLPIIQATFGDMNSKWVGETTERAMQVFQDAIAQAPCVLFLDEIDSILVNRGGNFGADSEAPKTVNAILTKLVDIRWRNVVVIAATNYPDRLDSASIREGRFDYKIEIPNPDYEARVGLLEEGAAKAGLLPVRDAILIAAARWEGFSVARIKGLTQEMQRFARTGKKNPDFDDLLGMLRKVQGFKGSPLPENTLALSDLNFDADIKERLISIARRMDDIEAVERFGGTVPSGVLFYGPPGTGKTATAMALAKSTDWAFLQTSGQDLIAKEDEMERLVKRAADLRPCILFIDEADDILANRCMSPQTKMATNKLLTLMQGAGGKFKDVLFIAATNHPDLIDEAVLRGGRFTEKVEFRLPGQEVVANFVDEWMKNSKARFEADFHPATVAEILVGQSLANVQEVLSCAVNNAISRMQRSDDAGVNLRDIEAGLYTVTC